MSITGDHPMTKGGARVQRVEVFTGLGRRRLWTAEEKASIVAESHAEEGGVSLVARRHGLSPSQLFAWRRAAREGSDAEASASTFVPAIVDAPSASPETVEKSAPPDVGQRHSIELEVKGSSVFIWAGAEPAMVTAIIGALKSK
jgi:transposase